MAVGAAQWHVFATTAGASSAGFIINDSPHSAAVSSDTFHKFTCSPTISFPVNPPPPLTLPVLRTLHSVLTPTLARDFLTLLPAELVSLILSFLPYEALARASRVSRPWQAIIDSDPVLWRDLLKTTNIWFGGESENAFAKAILPRRQREYNGIPPALPLPHPYKILFKSRHLTRTRWVQNSEPKHRSFFAHGSSVVTCLIFSHGRIISASDDHSIHVYCPMTGDLLRSLDGHEGGVWALAATKDILVSGSTDRTVRIWDPNDWSLYARFWRSYQHCTVPCHSKTGVGRCGARVWSHNEGEVAQTTCHRHRK